MCTNPHLQLLILCLELYTVYFACSNMDYSHCMHVYTTESETSIMVMISRPGMLLSRLLTTYNNRECMYNTVEQYIPEKVTSALVHGLISYNAHNCNGTQER